MFRHVEFLPQLRLSLDRLTLRGFPEAPEVGREIVNGESGGGDDEEAHAAVRQEKSEPPLTASVWPVI